MQQDLFCASLHSKINVCIATHPVLCYVCIWGVFLFFFFPYHGTSILYAKMPQNSVSVNLHSFSIPLWLAPSCSALPSVCFPFTDVVPPSLPSLFAAAFFWSLSPLLDKEWHGQKTEEEEDRGMSNCLVLLLSKYSISLFCFSASFVQNSWVFSKRWQSMVSDSEVGTFDRHLMWQQIDVI